MNKSQTGRPNLSRNWICSMPKCITPVLSKNKGMCSKHWQRLQLGSDKLLREWFTVTFECQCGKVFPYPTSCDKCYKARLRAEKRGTAEVTRIRGRNKSHKVVGYRAIHQRIKLWKGSAKIHTCINPEFGPHPAQEWALQVEPTHWEEKPGTNGQYFYGFTQNVDDYAPMCCHHHRKFDKDNKYHADDNPNFRKEDEE
jgi:hypothetical protein